MKKYSILEGTQVTQCACLILVPKEHNLGEQGLSSNRLPSKCCVSAFIVVTAYPLSRSLDLDSRVHYRRIVDGDMRQRAPHPHVSRLASELLSTCLRYSSMILDQVPTLRDGAPRSQFCFVKEIYSLMQSSFFLWFITFSRDVLNLLQICCV